MTEEDKFCLKWNDFQDNIVRAHHDLRSDRFDFKWCSPDALLDIIINITILIITIIIVILTIFSFLP